MKQTNNLSCRSVSAIFAALTLTLLLSGAAQAQGASATPYTLEQSVIAGGGGTSADTTNNLYSITGTIGQSVTATSSASPFTINSGFFTAAPLAPTAASVTMGGRVTNASGAGVTNILMSLTNSSGGVKTAKTDSNGYYSFSDVLVGETYIITATGKRFSFSQPSQVVNVSDEMTEINFVGTSEKRLRVF